MRHPYQPLTRDRSRRPLQQTNDPSIVTWIVAAFFAFILIAAFAAPIFHHLLENGR